MQTSDFHFDLPDELIAQEPLANRSDSRLLTLAPPAGIAHQSVRDLPALLNPGDLLVFNDTRVIPARLFGAKATGGKLEMLVERVLSSVQILVKLRSSKAPKPGSAVVFAGLTLQVLERREDLFVLTVEAAELASVGASSVADWLDKNGELPLPPYISRTPDEADAERYQTVFAEHKGAVAAPTAGLHFDKALLAALAERGVRHTTITLHVGAGTYQPVRVSDFTQHKMHSERVIVSAAAVADIKATKANGNRVIAVGTTAVRSLESAARFGMAVKQSKPPIEHHGIERHSIENQGIEHHEIGPDEVEPDEIESYELAPYEGDTSIFLYPGCPFHVVDGLLTNFHLPESTLLMLVSAFAGTESVLAAYQEAVAQRYRFFSYGDAMLVWPQENKTV